MTPDHALQSAIDQLADVQLVDNTVIEARQARIELTEIITRLFARLSQIYGEQMTQMMERLTNHETD